ncbi:vegetative cell wall protein gp1-like isoform X3 [Daphnia pulex]|uniref:vegetative cell wall protein gp1-like isoform X3 n=1 Tax=Daphnia pulex TaxID=6669 RepID=UPI001EE15485|nr:vegetative cell wall protein gp1-like isoform X3 [Daphnia pulex]
MCVYSRGLPSSHPVWRVQLHLCVWITWICLAVFPGLQGDAERPLYGLILNGPYPKPPYQHNGGPYHKPFLPYRPPVQPSRPHPAPYVKPPAPYYPTPSFYPAPPPPPPYQPVYNVPSSFKPDPYRPEPVRPAPEPYRPPTTPEPEPYHPPAILAPEPYRPPATPAPEPYRPPAVSAPEPYRPPVRPAPEPYRPPVRPAPYRPTHRPQRPNVYPIPTSYDNKPWSPIPTSASYVLDPAVQLNELDGYPWTQELRENDDKEEEIADKIPELLFRDELPPKSLAQLHASVNDINFSPNPDLNLN